MTKTRKLKRRQTLRDRSSQTRRSAESSKQFENLEERMLLTVDFVPAPLGGDQPNRADQVVGLSAPFTQPSIALSTVDPGQLSVANESFFVQSTNAGTTFGPAFDIQSLLGDGAEAAGSADLTYTREGELKWVALQDEPSGTRSIGVTFQNGAMGISTVPTSDGGLATRPVIASDNNHASDSPYSGYLYVSFTDEATNRVLLSRSVDGVNWSSPVAVSDVNDTTGGTFAPVAPAGVTVAPNGDVYVAYHYQQLSTPVEGADSQSNADGKSGQVIVRRSIDGGLSFISREQAFLPGQADVSLNVQTVSGTIDRARFWNQGSRQPTVLADPAREGHIYVIASDDPDNLHGVGDEGNIVFARSTDFGATWDSRTIDLRNSLQVMPQAEIDEFGNLVIAWYDSRRETLQGSEDFRLDVYATYSTDGGSTFADSFVVTDVNNPIDPVTPNTGVVFPGADRDLDGRTEDDGDETYSLGSYFDIELFGGTGYVVWNGNERVIGIPSANQVYFDVFPIYGTLHVAGLDTDDTFLVRTMPGNEEFLEVWVNGQREYAGLRESLVGGIQFDGMAGNDTLVVDFENSAGDPVPPGGIFFDGNIPEGGAGVGDKLDILTAGQTIDFQNESSDLDAGLFVIGDSAAISFDSVERTQTGSTDYLRPDALESNDSFATSSVLGSEPAVTLRDLTIHDLGEGQSNPDFFRVTASQTGILLINSLFDNEQGDLDMSVMDSRGNVIAVGAGTTDGERIRIPVVAQESYVVSVVGADGAINSYSLEVENFAVPAPQSVQLDAASDSGMMNDDGITADLDPSFTIQADMGAIIEQGLVVLTAEEATAGDTPGAAVFVTVRDAEAGLLESGYATPLGDDLFSFDSGALPDGNLVVSASVHIFDVRQDVDDDGEVVADPVVAPSLESAPIQIQLDTDPGKVTSPQLLPSSDSGMSRRDNVTNIMQPAFVGVAGPNEKVRVFANGLLVGETVAGSDGRWEITVEPLTDGIYDMTTQSTDLAGNSGESPLVTRVEIDKTAPNTPYLDLIDGSDTGLSNSDNVTGDNTLSFTMTTTDDTAIGHLDEYNFKYRIYVRPEGGGEVLVYNSVDDDTIPAENIQGGFTNLEFLSTTLDELPDGTHNFKLEVEDRAGNISHDFLLDIDIDTSLPAPLTLDLVPESDTGMDDADNVTRFSRPTFNGSGEVGAVVNLYAGDQLIGNGIVGADATFGEPDDGIGAWQITSGSLDDGVHVITATVVTDSGEASSEPLTIEIDSLQPNTPSLDLIPDDDSGHANYDNITNVSTPQFHFATQDPGQSTHTNSMNYKYRLFVRLESGAEELVYESVGDSQIPDSATDGMFTSLESMTRQISRGLPDGVHNFKLEVEDRAGNISEDTLLNVQIDTVLEGDQNFEMLSASDSGMSDTDRVTNVNQPSFSGLAEVGAEVTLFADGFVIGTATVGRDDISPDDSLGEWTVTSIPLADGVYDIQARVEDWAGNALQTNTVQVEVDTEAPNTPYLDLDISSDNGISGTDNVTSIGDLLFNMTTTDPRQADHIDQDNYKFRLFMRTADQPETLVYDSSTDDTLDTDLGFTSLEALQTTVENLTEGVYNFKLEVEDRAGNISHDTILEVIVGPGDTDIPTTIELVSSSDTGMDSEDGVTRISAPVFAGLGEANGSVQLFANGELVGTGRVGGDLTDGREGDGVGLWQVTAGDLDDGIYEVLAVVEDEFGNLASSQTVTIEVDTFAPNTPYLDLLPADDTGLSNQDNVTANLLPTFHMATLDPNQDDHLNPFNYKFRLFVRLDSGVERLVYDSASDDGFPSSAYQEGFTSLENLRREIDLGVPDGVHDFKLEVEDRAGNISEDFLLGVTIDTQLLPSGGVSLDLLGATDTGMSDRDDVTRIDRPTFTGVAEVGATVTIFANGQVVGTGVVGSDETDFVNGDGLGVWEVRVDALDDGSYEFVAHIEDLAGNFDRSESLTVEIDTTQPNTPFLDLINDTGSSDHDEITGESSLTFNMTTTDPELPGGRASEFNYKYRVYLRPEGGEEVLLYNSVLDPDIDASELQGGFTSLSQIQTTLDALPDGVHNFKLEVEDRAGNISEDFLLNVLIDTQLDAPDNGVTIDLLASSDTGMSDRDNVTSINQPAFAGIAEVGATVTIFANGRPVGVGVVGSDETDFVPDNGLGAWEVTVEPLDDGTYELLAHVEDAAGNFLRTESLSVEIDTTQPNTPYLDLLNDNGHANYDNITGLNELEFNMTTEDPGLPGGRASEFNYKYRIFLRPEGGAERLVYNSVVDTEIDAANIFEGFTDLEQLQTTLGALPDGIHNFKLEVEDRAGNISEDFLLTVQIDTQLDGTPDIDLIASSDTGMMDDDNVTGINQPAFTGVSEVGSTVRLMANGVLIGEAEVHSDDSDGNPGDGLGIWEITSEPLDDGIHVITADVEDWAGNIESTESLTIEVDTIEPNTPYLDLIPASDSGLSSADEVTNDVDPIFNMTTTDPNQDSHLSPFNYKYRVFLRRDSGIETLLYDSASDGDAFAASSYEDGFTSLETLRRELELAVPDGVHNLKLEVEDRAGNISHDFLLNVTQDTVLDAPNGVISIDLTASSDSGMSGEDNVTNQDRPTFTGIAEVGAMVTLISDGQVIGTGIVGSDETDLVPGDGLGRWEIISDSLVDGVHEVLAHVEDLAGNFLRSDELTIEVDTRAPNTPFLDLVSASDTGIGGRDEVTSDSTLTFTMTTTDESPDAHLFEENYKFRLYVRPEGAAEALIYNSVTDGTIPADAIQDGLIDLNFLERTLTELPEGEHNFKLEVEDRAGNISEDFLLNVTIDTSLVPPTIDLLASSDSGMSDSDGVTRLNTPTFSGTGDVGDRVSLFANGRLVGTGVVGSDLTDLVPGDGRGAWEVTSESLDDGIYDIVAQFEDEAGNFEQTEAFQIEIDTLEPNTPHLDLITISDTGHSNHDNITGDNTPTFAFTTEDPGQADHLSQFNYKYRLYLRAEGLSEFLIYDSVTDGAIDEQMREGAFTSLEFLQRTFGPLPDGLHNVKLEVEDRAGNISHDVVLDFEIDSSLPDPGQIDLLSSSDTGMLEDDNVTNKDQPAFSGLGTPGTQVRLFANGEFVGTAEVGSDESDGTPGDGLGIWEITSEPLDDGVYEFNATFEDWAGNISTSSSTTVEVDTIAPNTPHLDLLEPSDSGRHNDDNITNADILTFSATTEDPNSENHEVLFPGGENLKYRLFVRPESGAEFLVYDSSADIALADQAVDGFVSLNQILTGVPGLPEGLHNFKLEVEDRAGNISQDFLLDVLIDRTATKGTAGFTSGDTGIWGIDSTFGDNITGDANPVIGGIAEANNLVTLRVNGEIAGSTVVLPTDGDDAFQMGFWELVSGVTFQDGTNEISVTFEDPAGNQVVCLLDDLDLVIDTTGPRILNVTQNETGISVFDPKPAGGPDDLVDSVVVTFIDGPERPDGTPYAAVLSELALEEGNYRLIGDANGNIPITNVTIVSSDDGPGTATTAVRLDFGVTLPDDRYTFTVFDRIADAAGNPLDGDSGANGPFAGNAGLLATPPIFPTGDGNHGGDFLARFTVDSRPEIGVWAAGSVYTDTNGNFQWDPTNTDYVNRDISYAIGFTSDDIFAGNFAGPNGVADGYDKLAAYGRYGGWVDGTYRWLVDLDNDGVVDIDVEDPADVNGLPVAGNFDPDTAGDQVALYTGDTWYFDTDGDYLVDLELESELTGYPVVGDFDRDGFDDLATWADDTYTVDLANGTQNGWDGVADTSFRFGFIGVRERPIAADMDQDGFDDLGLWVPDRGGATPRETGEWYWLVSGGRSVLDRITPSNDPVRNTTNEVLFRPVPFGNDIFAQFGDQFAIPVVGNFDPPTIPGLTTPERIFTNPDNDLDINDDGFVSPRDALIAISHLNTLGPSSVEELDDEAMYLDTNNDGWVTARDVLRIVNHLNAGSIEAGEPVDVVDSIVTDVAAAFAARASDDSDDDSEEDS